MSGTRLPNCTCDHPPECPHPGSEGVAAGATALSSLCPHHGEEDDPAAWGLKPMRSQEICTYRDNGVRCARAATWWSNQRLPICHIHAGVMKRQGLEGERMEPKRISVNRLRCCKCHHVTQKFTCPKCQHTLCASCSDPKARV